MRHSRFHTFIHIGTDSSSPKCFTVVDMTDIDGRAEVRAGQDGEQLGFGSASSSLTGKSISLREPCPDCGCVNGTITTKNGQDVTYCTDCGRYRFNATRSETGRPRRSLSTRRNISPSQRARIIVRDGPTCELCNRRRELVIGHAVSLRDGYAVGLSDALLYSDANLVALCAECNAGLGAKSIPAYRMLIIASLRAHHKRGKQS
jgi:5-methylcytosine-specific restriction endonuclease McrA